jgi:tRNA pseudouridine(55) synthase
MSLSQVLNLYKEKGETPLERLKRFKAKNPEYLKVKMTYAGRLDPMAEGVLLVLSGDEIKNKQVFLDNKKEYEAEILFGFATDSFDVLGKVTEAFNKDSVTPVHHREYFHFLIASLKKIWSKRGIQDVLTDLDLSLREDKINNQLNNFVGKFSQKYPIYSSKTLKGKALFDYAKSTGLSEEDIPNKEVEIFSIKQIGFDVISKEDLRRQIVKSVSLVNGDFRQEEILAIWEENFKKSNINNFSILKIKVDCSSGTYIRALAKDIGQKLFSIPSLALSIKRISVGKYNIDNSIK